MKGVTGLAFACALAAVVSACGGGATSTPTQTSSTPQSPSPSPTPHVAQSVIALLVDGVTIRFVREDGQLLGSRAFGLASTYDAYTTAGGRFWYVASADHHLHILAPDGTDTNVAALQDVGSGNPAWGLAVSPDGQQWAWGVLITGSSGPTRTRIDVGGVGATTRLALQESTDNAVLTPIAWTSRGIVVSRNVTGIGGCCYLTPETAGRAVMLVDPATLQVTQTWAGCATAAATPAGSLACVASSSSQPAGSVVVHGATAADVTLSAQSPVGHVGWAQVDEAQNRVIFSVIHSFGAGGGDGAYVIDTEQGDLTTRAVTKLFDQVTLDAVLPDGKLVVTSAPPAPSSGQSFVIIRSNSGAIQQIGPNGAGFLAGFQLSG